MSITCDYLCQLCVSSWHSSSGRNGLTLWCLNYSRLCWPVVVVEFEDFDPVRMCSINEAYLKGDGPVYMYSPHPFHSVAAAFEYESYTSENMPGKCNGCSGSALGSVMSWNGQVSFRRWIDVKVIQSFGNTYHRRAFHFKRVSRKDRKVRYTKAWGTEVIWKEPRAPGTGEGIDHALSFPGFLIRNNTTYYENQI